MDPTIRLPGITQPAEGSVPLPRDAASVILVREGSVTARGGLEVHLLRRHSRMPFAPDVLVFPGGGVDSLDAETPAGWAGPSISEWSTIMGTDDATASIVLIAAVRETFEETGVLFASPSAGQSVVDTGGEAWERDRQRLLAREVSLGKLLDERSLTIRTDLLAPWAQWTTPEFEPRRYRTWFFVAALSPSQLPKDISGETTGAEWRDVRGALRSADEGDGAMFPPQYCICLELFEFDSIRMLRDHPLRMPEVLPSIAFDDQGAYLTLPQNLIELGLAVGEEMNHD